jgi:hypothetical protein
VIVVDEEDGIIVNVTVLERLLCAAATPARTSGQGLGVAAASSGVSLGV